MKNIYLSFFKINLELFYLKIFKTLIKLKMKKLILLTFIFVLYISTINAADPKGVFVSPVKDYSYASKSPSNRIFVGGDIGATFGDYTQISINPLIGYRISNEVSTGLQFVYNHSWQYINKDQVNQTTLQSNTYGGNAFLQYNPIPSFYLKGEFEYDSYTNYETTQGTKVTNAVPFLFLGAGSVSYTHLMLKRMSDGNEETVNLNDLINTFSKR